MMMNTVVSPAPGSTSKSAEQPLNRACEACRGLKVRCLPDNDSQSGKCARCAKSGRPCHYATPQKRRQRKRTDTRVAELEREVRAMRSLLGKESRGKSHETPGSDDYDGGGDDGDVSSDEAGSTQNLEQIPEDWTYMDAVNHFSKGQISDESGQKQGSKSPSGMLPDVIDRGILSLSKATEFFNIYVKNLVWHTPIVGFPEDVKVGEIRATKPVLFLSVITAACGTMNHPLYTRLHEEMLRVYADRVIISGEKTLELVQSMLITAAWHFPPEDFKELKFYQYIHLAATMALDIGLGSRRSAPSTGSDIIRDAMETKLNGLGALTSIPNNNSLQIPYRPALPDPILDRQRTFLACYILCAGVAMALRRPSMLRFTAWMTDCLDCLEHSPMALPTDQLLVAWVKMQHIADECGASFAFDDPSAKVRLSDQRILFTLKIFESRLEEWKNNLPAGILNGPILMNFYQNKIFLAEFGIIGLHEEQNTAQGLENSESGENSQPLSTAYISALMTAVDSAQALLDVFLSMTPEVIRHGPVLTYVRVCYAIVLEIKIAVAASRPSSQLGKILDVESLKIDLNIKNLVEHLSLVSDSRKYRIPSKFLAIIQKLSLWHDKVQASRIPRMDQGAQHLLTSLVELAVEGDKSERKSSKNSFPLSKSGRIPESDSQSSPHGKHIPDAILDYNGNINAPQFTTMDSNSRSGVEGGLYTGEMDIAQSASVPYSPYAGQSFLPMDMDMDLFGLYSGLGTATTDFNAWIPDPSAGFGAVPALDWNGNFN